MCLYFFLCVRGICQAHHITTVRREGLLICSLAWIYHLTIFCPISFLLVLLFLGLTYYFFLSISAIVLITKLFLYYFELCNIFIKNLQIITNYLISDLCGSMLLLFTSFLLAYFVFWFTCTNSFASFKGNLRFSMNSKNINYYYFFKGTEPEMGREKDKSSIGWLTS